MESWKRKALSLVNPNVTLDAAIGAAAQKYDVDPTLLRALADQESGGEPTAYNEEGDAHGPFQLTQTVMDQFKVDNPYDVVQAAEAAAQYLREGLLAHSGDIEKALMYYHGGPNQQQWGPKTQAHAQNVMARMPQSSAVDIAATGDGGGAGPAWQERAREVQQRFDDLSPPPVEQPVGEQEAATAGDMPPVDSSWPSVLSNALFRGVMGAGDIGQMVFNPGDRLASQLTGVPSVSEQAWEQARGLGLDAPGTEPTGMAQKAAAWGIEGAVGGLPLGGPVGMIPGAGGEIAARTVSEATGSPLLGLLAGAAGGHVAGRVGDIPGRMIGAAQGNVNPVMQAAERLGFQPRVKSTVTGKQGLAQQTAEFLPFGPGRLRMGALDEDAQLSMAASSLASKLGPAQTLEEAGLRGQQAARQWKDVLPKRLTNLWSPVDTAMQAANRRVGTQGLYKAFTDLSSTGNLPKHVKDTVDKFLQIRLARLPTWREARSMEEFLHSARGVSEEVRGPLLSGIASDMKRSAGAAGKANLFDNAMAESNRLRSFDRNVVGKLVSTDQPLLERIRPEQAASTLLNTAKLGDTTLEELRRELPSFADDLGAVKLREVANTVPRPSATEPVIATRILDDLGPERISPEGYAALFAPIKQDVDALGTLAKATSKTAKEYIESDESLFRKFARWGVPGGAIWYGSQFFGPAIGASPLLVGPAASIMTVPPKALANPLFKYMAAESVLDSPELLRLGVGGAVGGTGE